MNSELLSRRWFLQGSGTLAGGSLLRLGAPALAALSQAACSARDEGGAYTTLSAAEGRDIDAIAARIIPTTDTPGAREAGVVFFIDQALGSHMADSLGMIRSGYSRFAAGLDEQAFADLDARAQDRYLESREATPFFQVLRFMTLCGMFCMAKYGGNRDNSGTTLLGIDAMQHGYQPPFGYYDAHYTQGETDGD